MLRLCTNNAVLHPCVLFNKSVLHELASKFRCSIVIRNGNLSRHFASQPPEVKADNIYYGPLTPQIRAVKTFSLGSSVLGLIAQPIIIREAATIGSTSLLVAICSVVGFFTFVTPLMLHFITKKYVSHVTYNPDTSTYRATTLNFFLMKKHVEFKLDDVHVPDIPGMFTTMHIKGKPLFIEARHFNNPIHYAKMMGYDKPIDLKLGSEEDVVQGDKK